MTDTPSPFDDPEFAAMLKRAGITHRPGMAAELMDEIGPLLAADGIDMNTPDQEMDLDDLNEAMGQAVERRNMELVTPVGDARALTKNLLREFVIAHHAAAAEREQTILGRLRPDPTKRHPSFSHLIGVASETLDAWYTDPELRATLSKITFAGVPPEVKPAVTDIEALARKGRVFRSIERLLFKHNGAVVAAAVAYAVAATVVVVADHQQQPIRSVLDALLPREAVSGGFGAGSAFGAAAAQQVSEQDQVDQFEMWLVENEDITICTPEDIDVFETIVENAATFGLDPFDPNDFDALIDVVMQLPDDSVTGWSLAILHDYVHFRMEGDDAQDWEEPHDLIDEIGHDAPALPPELQAVMDGLENIPVQDRHAALVATPLVSGIAKLMAWIGKSKPVTGTGMPKRADIGEVAAMLGIDAIGVAKAPPFEGIDAAVQMLDLSKPAPRKPTLHVQSAKEIGELRAWLSALEIHEGIIVSSTRMMPGPISDQLAAPQPADLEPLEMFIVSYIREYLLAATDEILGGTLVMSVIRQLITLAQAHDILDTAQNAPGSDFGSVLGTRHLRSFELMGLLEIRNSTPYIPVPLRPVVMLGAMLALADLELAK